VLLIENTRRMPLWIARISSWHSRSILIGMNRRYFLSSAIPAGMALRASNLASPNDTVRVACVGTGGRGRDHINAYNKMTNVEIAALCDIDESRLNVRLAEVEKAKGKRPVGYTDLRKLLEDKSIDAVSTQPPAHTPDDLGLPGRQGRLH